ncbi:23S rRNA (pseudouridine(1915)-N(3))-methyltransferase RlmH [Natronospirillum operosum]|uniref:Ribosomal RNA large subunit methyltransferase H n=1 Tax=Natronospirillum operosum TaxID=2759953 RepID=A0A4Z0W534_9GAMM|nr:23S rRNA (pseudouridine(1915)-N(3))-methyltransferase RlmH [Natronospirillum operosum]TGG92752.1 23S rRNA (pseudouridine(1915)-N(3))-methyltransferase RlmH [Natronospirillum operosum]
MKLRIHSVAGRMPSWVDEGVAEYGRRLPRELQPDWVNLPLGKRTRNVKPIAVKAEESDRLLQSVRDRDFMVLLDLSGKAWTTEQLARELREWQLEGRDVSLVIGGPDGVDDRVRQRADRRWSLSALTLPHPLVRIVLAEQLYRAWTVNQGHPYHK